MQLKEITVHSLLIGKIKISYLRYQTVARGQGVLTGTTTLNNWILFSKFEEAHNPKTPQLRSQPYSIAKYAHM